MAAKRSAEVTWDHDLLHGEGHVRVDSGALPEFPVTWVARSEQSGGKTSPEELLAAAHASCLAMALSAGLARAQTPPDQLKVRATATFDKVGDAWRVTQMDIAVAGKVPKITAAQFESAVKSAAENCPISQALKNNVAVHATAQLL